MGHKGYLGAPRQRTNGCSVTRVTRGDYIGDRRMRSREKELEVALGMLRAAEAGRGGILLVEGEPGIGKSRFLEESAAAATARGFTLAWGLADARRMPGTRVLVPTPEELLTPAGAADCGRPWWDAPGAGPDGGLALHTAEGPLRPAESQLHTADRPMLIVLDDLECADRAMLWGLRGLARQPRTRPPLWLLARSTASAYSDAQWLFTHLEHSGAARLRLGPLGASAVADVAAGVLDAVPDEAILALAAGTGGNPLLLTELLAGLRDEGKIQAGAGSARLASGQLPKRVLAVIQRWTTALGPPAGPPGAAPADRPAAAGPGWPGERGRRSPGQRGPAGRACRAGPAGPRS